MALPVSQWAILLTLLAVSIRLLHLLITAIWRAFGSPLSHIPGPILNKFSTLPWMSVVIRGVFLDESRKLHRRHGSIVRIGPQTVLVSDPALVRQILVEWDLPKSPIYEKFRQDASTTTLFTERDRARYRRRRRLLSNGFSMSALNAIEPLIWNCCDDLEATLDFRCTAQGGIASIDAYGLLSSLTSDIMSAAFFGGSWQLVKNGEHPLRTRITNFMKRAAFHQVVPIARYIPGVPGRSDPELERIIQDIIARGQQTLKSKEKGNGNDKDLLQLLLAAHDEDPVALPAGDLHAEMIVFLLAGAETTSTVLTFALLFLLNHGDKMRELVAEIDAALPDRNGSIAHEQTKRLAYLNAVINETMRLMPPAAGGFARQTKEPLKLNDYLVPENTCITANTTAVHHDPSIWPDPESFLPERWLDDNRERNDAFFPFSAGSRTCIGKHLAMMEMRLILTRLLRRFELHLVPGQSHEVRYHTVLHLKAGRYFVKLRRRGEMIA